MKKWIENHKIASTAIITIISGVIEYFLWFQVSKEAYDIQYKIITNQIPTYGGFSWSGINSLFIGVIIGVIAWVGLLIRKRSK
jgi:hypothetical protein